MKKCISVITSIILLIVSILPAFATSSVDKPGKNAILSALYEADISAIREALDAKLITCEELTAYYLERIEKYNENYNCFITMCDDAIDIAKQRDADIKNGKNDGLLFGVPVVIKDNIDLKGYYTTNGHLYEKSKIADSNATVVDFLLSEGAVIIGKTNMSTDAQDSRISYSEIKGQTKNAYNTLLASGGSSGGSAAAVSLNFAAAGLGTDTNSSLRIPAVLNGCVSLRSTLKLIDYTGCTKLHSGRDVVGAVTRSVYDQAVMMDVLTNGQYKYTENLNKNALKGLRIGILKELSYAADSASITGTQEEKDAIATRFDIQERTDKYIDDEVSTAFSNAVKELESCGAEVITVSMPKIWNSAYTTLIDGHIKHNRALYNEFQNLLTNNNIDAVIFPSYLSAPLKSGTDENGTYWNAQSQVFLNNCRALSPSASLPEISIPIGSHSSGAGIGLEIAGLKNSEQLLLNIAYSYEQSYNHRTAPKNAPDLYAEFNSGTLREIIDKYVLSVNTPVTDESETSETAVQSTQEIEKEKTEKLTVSKFVPVFIGVAFVCTGIIISVIIKKRHKNKDAETIYDANIQDK